MNENTLIRFEARPNRKCRKNDVAFVEKDLCVREPDKFIETFALSLSPGRDLPICLIALVSLNI